jgi:hypothetical protein
MLYVYRVPGNPISGPILEHLYLRYTYSMLLGDINVDLLVDLAHSVALRDILDNVSLSIISGEAYANFAAQDPTLINVCATCEPEST